MAVRKLKKLSVVSIFYNEEENVHFLYERVTQALSSFQIQKEYIFVENGSNDSTFVLLKEIAEKDPAVKVVKLSRNFGQQNGYTSGIENVSPDTDAVVLIDGDVQDPPEMIPSFISKWEEGYDVVYGIRKKRKGNPIKIFFYILYYRVLGLLSDTEFRIPKDAGEFGLLDVKVWRYLCAFPETNRLIRGLRAWIGFKQTGIEYTRDARKHGEPKFNLRKMFSLALDGICSLSGKPIRITFVFGLAMCALAFTGLCYLIVLKWGFGREVQDSLITQTVVLTVGGVQLICLGVVSEYIRRIYDESKGRPKYIIDSIYSASTSSQKE